MPGIRVTPIFTYTQYSGLNAEEIVSIWPRLLDMSGREHSAIIYSEMGGTLVIGWNMDSQTEPVVITISDWVSAPTDLNWFPQIISNDVFTSQYAPLP